MDEGKETKGFVTTHYIIFFNKKK